MRIFDRKTKSKNNPGIAANFPEHEPVTILAGMAQSVGKTRDHMEDAAMCLVWQQGFCEQKRSIGLFIVADGMGGHSNGELASKLAIQRFYESFDLSSLVKAEKIEPDLVHSLMETSFNNAQDAVLENVNGGGSTLTVTLVVEKMIFFAHVGDSRLYLISEHDQPERLTRDHSLVQRLVDLGQITTAEAEYHPQKNVLFRALGQTDGFKVDQGQHELTRPMRLLLCSDGLWGLVDEKRLTEVVKGSEPAAERAKTLCKLANEAGGNDNISTIVVDIF